MDKALGPKIKKGVVVGHVGKRPGPKLRKKMAHGFRLEEVGILSAWIVLLKRMPQAQTQKEDGFDWPKLKNKLASITQTRKQNSARLSPRRSGYFLMVDYIINKVSS